MKAKLGVAPIAWSNDDLPAMGGNTPLETCLAEARQAGFTGIETGGKFPKTSGELGPILKQFDLSLVSGWYSGTLLDNNIDAERRRVESQLSMFRDLGADVIVYGETAGTIQNKQDRPLASRRRLTPTEIQAYGERLTTFAAHCRDEGVPLSFHHHMGTAIETEEDIDLLMNATGEEVGFLYDTGHLVFSGADPLRVLQRHGARINHVHTKDVRQHIMVNLDRDNESFLDAVIKGVYTVPGDGMVDFAAVTRELVAFRYEGWFVVEAEQDPEKAPPLEFAQIGYRTMRDALTQAGYELS
jgi:inosose dehydratase